ncbi:hypothetical protein TWF225_006334 [Orbilia oligospora]|uniref:Uncharacterized protein n=1 Tax=Orbilia oligospora TaxID=2813651 RepID=A0A7C8KC96_ORBOL|nr:hypothetical protein TWF751_007847 [Orbilia oligospora]KAF3183192.1 hypothetical protein TWF225_006334 [Orbilia oligospora]KAF3251191.1 hypothetical protein TWF217_008113 [Orbilia oligospora]KAF3267247.1 hypothetical protein TWF128_010181 [Orbilia oligospora]KAF3285153.1 hypothetical protein TWF132_009548 [Orbilia oligospora]
MPPKRQKRVGEPLASDTPQPPPSDNEHVKKRRRIERGFRRAVGKHVSDDGSDEDTDGDTDSSLSGDSSSDSKNPQTKPRDLKDESGSYSGDRGRGQKQEQEQEQQKEGDDDDDDEVWEILLDETKSVDRKSAPIKPSENLGDGDLTLTFDKSNSSSLPMKKKGVSSRERRERLYTHIVHVICLMYHGHRRNVWLNDKELWEIILKCMEGTRAKKSVEVYLDFVNPGKLPLDSPKYTAKKSGRKGKGKGKHKTADLPLLEPLERPSLPPCSSDTKLVEILGLLMRLWKRNFHIDAPGLRKRGYSENVTGAISADKESQTERIQGLDDFRQRAKDLHGSRDTGAQLFTALLRALGFESRLVFSICPLGYGFSKSEMREDDNTGRSRESAPSVESSGESSDYGSNSDTNPSKQKQSSSRQRSMGNAKAYDKDLKFPTFWSEVYSPITEQWIAIDPLVTGLILSKDDMSRLEPKGRIASKSKQQISYVIAYSADKSARDVTVRYLSGMVFPGKTKGFRMPIFGREVLSNQGDLLMMEEFDLFSERILKCFQPCGLAKTARGLKEDQDLLPKASTELLNPFKRDFPKSIAAYKNHFKYVLERHLKREDCILPGELPVHTLATGKASASKEEKVYSRQSIIVGKPAENWYREGRVIKKNEHPLKTVPSRAVTTNRKREIEDAKREGDTRAGLVSLYGFYQTEIYRPPPIIGGAIPKNAYGNIDCFVPSMVPVGAVHVPWGNAVRLSKKLGIEFAEAVTGFDFKNKRAVPRTEGVLCSEENADVLTEACRQDDEQKRLKDGEKRQQICLALWKRFLIGLRIVQRVEENYGSGTSEPAAAWETENTGRDQEQETTVALDLGDNSDLEEGGFFRE